MIATSSTTAALVAHRTGPDAAADDIDSAFDRYRHVVAAIFACHHRAPGADPAAASCACGAAWPCPQEALAAELLDWI